MPKTKKKLPTDAVLAQLRAFGLAYPGAHTKSPWPGHLDLAVKDKTFAYLSVDGEPIHISCKLPQTGAMALLLPFTSPTAYGLGKSGWVSAQFAPGEIPPVDMLEAWIDESYRAQAPKKLVATLGPPAGATAAAAVTAGPRSGRPRAPSARKTPRAPARRPRRTG